MINEKVLSNQSKENSSGANLTDIHSPKPESSEVEKIKQTYLPESKADNSPSEESIEQANDLKHPKPLKPNSLI